MGLNLIFFVLVPRNPDCNITQMNVVYRNSSSMTLNFTNTKPDSFCVQIQNEDQQHNKACRPAKQPVTFSNLSSSHRYTFSFFSFVSIENTSQLLFSESNCSFSAYTCKCLSYIRSIKYFKLSNTKQIILYTFNHGK